MTKWPKKQNAFVIYLFKDQLNVVTADIVHFSLLQKKWQEDRIPFIKVTEYVFATVC